VDTPPPAEVCAFEDIGLVICHVTESCNLHCRYCSAAAPDCGGGVSLMKPETALAAARHLLGRTRRRDVNWVFFGGEPLLAPLAWYGEVCDGVRAMAEAVGISLRFGMQSNATLLTDEVADFLAGVPLRPSISLDGPPPVHNTLREGAEETLTAIRRLVARNLTPTILVVMGPHNVDCVDEIIDFLRAVGIERTKFNIYQCAGRAGNLRQVSPSQLAAARLRVLDRVLGGDIEDVNCARLMRLVARPDGSRPDDYRGCGAPHCGAGIRHVAVSPDGRLFPCDRCQAAGVGCLGQAANPWSAEAVRSEVISFHRRHELQRPCASCPARKTCHSCCTVYRDSAEDVEVLCESSRLLFPQLMDRSAQIRRWVRQHPFAKRAGYKVKRPGVEAEANECSVRRNDGLLRPAFSGFGGFGT